MSRPSTRSRAISERGFRDRNYKLFLVHFHGPGFEPLRENFVERVKDGLRRRVFVIDLDEEVKELQRLYRKTKPKGAKDTLQPEDELAVALTCIEQCRREYDNITKIIESEKKFDLFAYWMANVGDTQVGRGQPKPQKGTLTAKKPLEKIPERTELKTRKTIRSARPVEESTELVCPLILNREHNKVGKGSPRSKRKYIEDEPQPSKLFIVLLGSNLNKLYSDFLRINEPVQAIIHFVPEKSAYDRLVPRRSYERFLRHTAQDIKSSFDSLRLPNLMKPVGLLKQALPVLSSCLAKKYATQIYEELSWYFYDVELLYQHYQLYYVNPFKEQNVEMGDNVSVQQLRDTAESLSIQGHFLKSPLPAAATDLASIVMFMESLISTVQPLDSVLTSSEIKLISAPLSMSTFSTNAQKFSVLASAHYEAFMSITQVKRYNRLIVEQNNTLFTSLVSYMDYNEFSTIYNGCLEYDISRRYIISTYVTDCVRPHSMELGLGPFNMPQYCKLYLSHDSVMQRLTHLLTECDRYEACVLYPGYTLYHFKRYYNEVKQQENLAVLPSRLCFRDFTLFQMEEFLRDLVTSEKRKSIVESDKSKTRGDGTVAFGGTSSPIDTNIFIRPNSLKVQKMSHLVQGTAPSSKPREVKKRGTKTLSEEQTARLSRRSFMGLAPGHPLLQGYKLDDVRQEVHSNTSSYHFEEGSLKFYEDRWCFDELNTNIHLNINQCSINFSRPRPRKQGISRNIHIRTKNELTCRIFGQEDECAQIVLNYPNGLGVYFHGNYSEQLWSVQETVNHESRRLMIPEGAVIVHYHAKDVIRILRHNGEVYELFQYELVLGEEEEMGEEEDLEQPSKDPSSQASENLGNIGKKLSKLISTIGIEEHNKESPQPSSKRSSRRKLKKKLLESIENELRFLNLISARYGLNYLHLKVTTTVGRVVVLTHKGKILEKRRLSNEEWHDYFGNESYAMRGDGVKIVWTENSLKCFHKDGTIFITGLEESLENLYWEEDFDSRISVSSSHQMAEEEEEYEMPPGENRLSQMVSNFLKKRASLKSATALKDSKKSYAQYVTDEQEEEPAGAEEDSRYVCYESDKFLIQHQCYAAVNFVIFRNFTNDSTIVMDIFAADKVRVQFVVDDLEASTFSEDVGDGGDEGGSEGGGTKVKCKPKNTLVSPAKIRPPGETVDGEEGEEMAKPIIKINVGEDVEVKVTDDSCEINALVERYDMTCGKIRDILKLGFQFDDDISSLFHEFVKIISQFKNYRKPSSTDIYFIQKDLSDECTEFQGFEFYKSLPQLGEYNFLASNSVIDLRALRSVSDLMSNNYEWFAKDLRKFPRFHTRQQRSQEPAFVPTVLAADYYCKIPHRLRNTEELQKFLEPFDSMTFKRTRVRIRSALEYYLYPEQRVKLKKLTSKMSWRRRLREHRRHLLIEMQRKGLYHAMLKHKEYPKYHQFVHEFRNHVSNIDFFDYVSYKCIPKDQQRENTALAEASGNNTNQK